MKFVVSPEIARHPDQPDQWKVSGVKREFASKEHADKVRKFLKTNPPDEVKRTLAQGKHVDHLLPGHLRKLPRWNAVHGVDAKKESVMSDRVQEMFFVMAHSPVVSDILEALECGCIDKLEDSRDALTMAMCEAGCPPTQHFNKKKGGCAKLSPELYAAVQQAHATAVRAKNPSDHSRAHEAMTSVAKDLHAAGFHQLGNLHAARAHQHKIALAN